MSFAGEQALEGFDAERLQAGIALDGEVFEPSGQLRLDVDQDPAFALAAAAAPAPGSGRRRRERLRSARVGGCAMHRVGEDVCLACHSSAPWVIHANRVSSSRVALLRGASSAAESPAVYACTWSMRW